MNEKHDWVISECNLGYDRMTFTRFDETEQEIKKLLMNMVMKHRVIAELNGNETEI